MEGFNRGDGPPEPLIYHQPRWIKVLMGLLMAVLLTIGAYCISADILLWERVALSLMAAAGVFAFVQYLKFELHLTADRISCFGAFGQRFARPFSDVESVFRDRAGMIHIHFRGWKSLGWALRLGQVLLDEVDLSTMRLTIHAPLGKDETLYELSTRVALAKGDG